jgi:hypothetical protein
MAIHMTIACALVMWSSAAQVHSGRRQVHHQSTACTLPDPPTVNGTAQDHRHNKNGRPVSYLDTLLVKERSKKLRWQFQNGHTEPDRPAGKSKYFCNASVISSLHGAMIVVPPHDPDGARGRSPSRS